MKTIFNYKNVSLLILDGVRRLCTAAAAVLPYINGWDNSELATSPPDVMCSFRTEY